MQNNYLIRRGAVYYYRRRIPTELLAHYAPKKEIHKSLGTSERREAVERARAMSVQHDKEFAALRTALNGALPSAEVVGYSNECEEFLADVPDETLLFPKKQRRQMQLHDDPDTEVGDVQALAARILVLLRKSREEAIASDMLDEFQRNLKLDLEWDKAALKGGCGFALPRMEA